MKILLFFLLLFGLTAQSQTVNTGGGRSRVPQGGAPPVTYDTIATRFTNSGSSTTGNWNNFLPATSLSYTDLIHLGTGAPTTIDLAISAYSSVTTTTMSGICTDPNAAGFPLGVANRTTIKSTAGNIVVTISGIPPGKKVDLVHYVGRNGVSASSTITSQGQSATIAEIDQNCSNVAKLTNLVETAGVVTFEVESSVTAKYLQGLYIILHD